MKQLLTALLALGCTLAAHSQESQTAYNFLRLPVSAHAGALGGENISVIEDDATLAFHNPALLSSVSSRTILLNYMNYMKGVNALSAAFSKPLTDKATMAVGTQYLNYGTLKQTNSSGVQTGEFSAKDIAVSGSFAYMLAAKLAGGIAAKVITSYIGSYHSVALGVDLGLNYYDSEHDWSVSLVAKSLGGQLKAYDEVFEKMPLDVQLGVSKRLTHTPFRFSATLVDLNHTGYKWIHHLVAGVDILLNEQIWVGAGYHFRRANEMQLTDGENSSAHGAGLSLGAGLNLDRFKLNVSYGKYHVASSSLLINVAYGL